MSETATISIRPEREEDHEGVFRVVAAAFGQDDEARSVDGLLQECGWPRGAQGAGRRSEPRQPHRGLPPIHACAYRGVRAEA